MEGIVRVVNQETGYFAIETEDGFTVFGTADVDDIESGNVMVGDLDSLTCESVLNNSNGEELRVEVRDIVTTLAAAEALLFDETFDTSEDV